MPQASDFIHDWNGQASERIKRLEIDDETLRDGLQGASVRQPDIATKRQCLRHMAALGIQRVDVGLPMSGQLEHIRQLLQIMKDESLPMRPGLAVRTVVGDLETVSRLRDEFSSLDVRANAFLGASRIRQWAEGWVWSDTLGKARGAVEWAKSHGVPVMFVTEDTTRSEPDDIRQLYLAAVEAGAVEVCVADTVGHALPDGAAGVVSFVRTLLDNAGYESVKLNWHGHSDRGFGLANAFAAVEAGADVVHGTILGIGERTGNTPLDQLLVNLKLLGTWRGSLDGLGEYVRLVSETTGTLVPSNYPAFGRDAFRTGTGVHAAAVVKAQRQHSTEMADSVYSSVPASLVGRRQVIEVGPLSGRWCAIAWLDAHGFPEDETLITRILTVVKHAERVLTDDEVRTAIGLAT